MKEGGITSNTLIVAFLQLHLCGRSVLVTFLLKTGKQKYLPVVLCFQRSGGIWAEENDGGKVRGEPSRDFAKVTCQQWEGSKSTAVWS